jgi:Flp pilus assembly protein TadG
MNRTVNNHRRWRTRRQRRSGAVIVEFAICAPILFLFFFAALEFSRVNMIRQTIENATYEGSRRGIVPGATANDCRNAAQLVLNTVSTNDATITVTPGVITPDTAQVTVAVTVPIDSNSWVTPFFFKNKSLANSMTMRRERFNANSVP